MPPYRPAGVPTYWTGRDPNGDYDKLYIADIKPVPPEHWWSEQIAQVFGFAQPFDVAVAALDGRLRPPLTPECRALILGSYGFSPGQLRKPLGVSSITDVRSLQRRSLDWFREDIPFLLWAHKVNPYFVKFRQNVPSQKRVELMARLVRDPLLFRGVSHLSKVTLRAIRNMSMPAHRLELTPQSGTSGATVEQN